MKRLGNISVLNEKIFGGVKLVEFAIKDEKNYALVTSENMTADDLYKALKSLGVEYVNKIPLKKGVVRPCTLYGMVIRVKGVEIDRVRSITMDEECLVEKIREKYETWVEGSSGFAARNHLKIEFDAARKTITNWKLDIWDDKVGEKVKEELEKASNECCIVGKFFGFNISNQMIYFLEKEEIEVDDLSPLQADIEEFEKECKKEHAAAVYKEYGSILEGVEFGPFEKFNLIPDDYVVIWSKRTKNTADSRQGRSHTYAYWAVKKGTKGVVEVTLPEDAPIGKIIGKGGEKIKALAREVGCKYIKIIKSPEQD